MDDRSSAEIKKSHSPPSTRHSPVSTLEVLPSVCYPEPLTRYDITDMWYPDAFEENSKEPACGNASKW
ncbi:hypothetical protein Tco_0195314 [Tanacetum coccineum]